MDAEEWVVLSCPEPDHPLTPKWGVLLGIHLSVEKTLVERQGIGIVGGQDD
jgi:hypothetical protein